MLGNKNVRWPHGHTANRDALKLSIRSVRCHTLIEFGGFRFDRAKMHTNSLPRITLIPMLTFFTVYTSHFLSLSGLLNRWWFIKRAKSLQRIAKKFPMPGHRMLSIPSIQSEFSCIKLQPRWIMNIKWKHVHYSSANSMWLLLSDSFLLLFHKIMVSVSNANGLVHKKRHYSHISSQMFISKRDLRLFRLSYFLVFCSSVNIW